MNNEIDIAIHQYAFNWLRTWEYRIIRNELGKRGFEMQLEIRELLSQLK